MKTLNVLIDKYTNYLQQGEIQIAYKAILEFIGKLRAEFIRNNPEYDVSSIYQGYMDMSYFSLSTKTLRNKGLKIAIVYLHEKGAFEVWLSARNRSIAKNYESTLENCIACNSIIFHDKSNPDSIVECRLTPNPNFEDPSSLIGIIDEGVKKFVSIISDCVLKEI